MPSTWSQILLHIVFSTKRRDPSITPAIRDRLYPHIGGIVRSMDGGLFAIGGVSDHVHLLIRWRTDESIAELVRTIKSRSSHWVHETFPEARSFAWQEGYSVFSVSPSAKAQVENYIRNQEEHHRDRSFKDELLTMLRASGVEFEEKYVFD